MKCGATFTLDTDVIIAFIYMDRATWITKVNQESISNVFFTKTPEYWWDAVPFYIILHNENQTKDMQAGMQRTPHHT